MATRRSPQDKKSLSYVKDRRNAYGQNDKSSRKNIRRNKRIPNRADRHRQHQLLAGVTGPVAVEAGESVEDRLLVKKSMWFTKRWRKCRDRRLADVVVYKLRRRARLGIADPDAVENLVGRIRRRSNRRS